MNAHWHGIIAVLVCVSSFAIMQALRWLGVNDGVAIVSGAMFAMIAGTIRGWNLSSRKKIPSSKQDDRFSWSAYETKVKIVFEEKNEKP